MNNCQKSSRMMQFNEESGTHIRRPPHRTTSKFAKCKEIQTIAAKSIQQQTHMLRIHISDVANDNPMIMCGTVQMHRANENKYDE